MHESPRGAIVSLRTLTPTIVLDLVAAIGIGLSSAMVISLLPTIGRRGGLEPLGLAALASAPFVANVAGLLAGRVGPRSTRQFALLRFVSAAVLVALPFAPMPGSVIAVAMIFWLGVAFTAPFQFRLWGSTYPMWIHARIIGLFGTGRAAAAAIAALLGGVLADRVGGAIAVAAFGAVGAICALAYAWLRRVEESPHAAYTARESLRAVNQNAAISRIALAQAVYGAGFIAAGPLFALVYVDRLNLSLADVGIIGVIGAVATTISSLAWGATADRYGAQTPAKIGSIVGVFGLVAYALAPEVGVVWVAALAVGVTLPALEIGIFAIIAQETPVSARAVTITGWNALMGARGVIAPFVVSSLVQVDVISVTTGLAVCALACALGIGLFWTGVRDRSFDIVSSASFWPPSS